MIKIKRKDTFSFYESFSDLIFCTLVLFLVLVLFLALNVNRKVEKVKEAEKEVEVKKAEIEITREQLVEEEKEIAYRRKNLQSEVTAIEKQESLVKEKQGKLDRLLGTYRFTGKKGISIIMLAVDLRGELIYPVPSWLVQQLSTSGVVGEEKEQKRIAEGLEKWRKIVLAAEGLTIDQINAIFSNTSLSMSPLLNNETCMLNDYMGEGEICAIILAKKISEYSGKGYALREIDGKRPSDVKAIYGYNFGDTSIITFVRNDKEEKVSLRFDPVCLQVFLNSNSPTLDYVTSGVISATGELLVSSEQYTNIQKKINDFREVNLSVIVPNDDIIIKASYSLPTLYFSSLSGEKRILVGDEEFSINQFKMILESVGGRGIAIEYVLAEKEEEIPNWITTQILLPTEFVNKAPDLPLALED